MNIENIIRSIPDYPQPGVIFRDITTLIQHPQGFRYTVDRMVERFHAAPVDFVAGIEARGFIIGGAIAHQLKVGFIAMRKKGKLPWKTVSQSYQLEYGADEIEIHEDAIEADRNILLVDDLIATGGTAMAAVKLINRCGGQVAGFTAVIDLPELGGSGSLKAAGIDTFTLVSFSGM